jgi:hypothetical protein
MTELQHALVGGAILMIIWLGFAQKYFISGKEAKAWRDFFKK